MSIPEAKMPRPEVPTADPMKVLPEPQYVDANYQEANDAYEDEDEELLFGPTMRPNDVPGQNGVKYGKPRPSKQMEGHLKTFAEAAREPGAPPELLQFVRLLAYHMGQEV
jgi:hypothetical protein